MATNLSTLRDELRARTGNRSTSALPEDRLDFLLRQSILQISSPKVHRHADLESTISVSTADGDDKVEVGATLWTIYSARDTTTTNVRRLEAVGAQTMDEYEKTSGPPLRYARWGSFDDGTVLELDPIPDGVYTLKVRGYLYPTFTLDGNDLLTGECPLREVYDEAVLLGAEYRAWMNVLQNPTRGLMIKNQLSDFMDTIISPYEGELDDMSTDVLAPDQHGTYGGWS